jgi:hypothetical protein
VRAVFAAAALVLAGCSQEITGTAVTAAGSAGLSEGGGNCATVSAPLADIPSVSTREPRLRIPVPSGWRRNTMMDSRIIRYAIVATGLIKDDFAPNAVVTLESAHGAQNPDEVFEQNRSNLVKMMGAFDLETESNTTCGFPSETTKYTAPAMGQAPERPIIMHAVVAQSGSTTYLSTLTVQTTDAKNPTYAHDADEIVGGFQLVLPKS